MDDTINEVVSDDFEGRDNNKKAWEGHSRAELELISHVKVLIELDWNLHDDHGSSDVDRGSLQYLYHYRDDTGGALCGRAGRYELERLVAAQEHGSCCAFCKEISVIMSQGWGGKGTR